MAAMCCRIFHRCLELLSCTQQSSTQDWPATFQHQSPVGACVCFHIIHTQPAAFRLCYHSACTKTHQGGTLNDAEATTIWQAF